MSRAAPVVGTVYRHFRNGKCYRIVGLARETRTLDQVVVYRALYRGKGRIADFQMWTRPLSDFTGQVWHKGDWTNRFEQEDWPMPLL